jgi:prophage antirepressor-like protein
MNTNPQTERETYQLIPFKFEDQIINMALIDSQPWFVAKNIGKVLGLATAAV